MCLNKELEEVDVIILQADGLIDEKNGYGYPIQKRLTELEIKSNIVEIANRTEILTELPQKPLIISGGMTEVTADIDWISELKSFVRTLIQDNQNNKSRRQPIFGICFGAQIIAECYRRGSVRYLEDPEIGVSNISLTKPQHPLFKGFEVRFPAYSFHYNQIWSEDVTILSDHHHKGHHFIQAFEVPNGLTFGVQFHPEFKQDEMLKLYQIYEQLIGNLGFDLRPVIESLPEISGNHLLLRNFYESYCK
ncbi:MAG: type 1 glutamine amidotransferase [Candidatus Thorarchaeota archaeon]